MLIVSFNDKPVMKLSAFKIHLRRRWALITEKFSVGLYQQHKSVYNDVWSNNNYFYKMKLSNMFCFGRKHNIIVDKFEDKKTFDSFCIGFIHIEWNCDFGGECEKCLNLLYPELRK